MPVLRLARLRLLCVCVCAVRHTHMDVAQRRRLRSAVLSYTQLIGPTYAFLDSRQVEQPMRLASRRPSCRHPAIVPHLHGTVTSMLLECCC
jgi:hypothetical protein